MQHVIKLRIFVASPGDVRSERDQLKTVVDELNTTIASPNSLALELVRWETHVAPALGRPQEVVNTQIGEYDIFIGIMWKRFGTPTGVAESGTEEEFRIAYKAWRLDPAIEVMFYFCQEPFMPTADDVDQFAKVLAFKTELASTGLVGTYPTHATFADVVRPHLTQKVIALSSRARTVPAAVAQGPALLQRQAWMEQADLQALTVGEIHTAPVLNPEEAEILLKKLPRGWTITNTPIAGVAKRALRKEFEEPFYDRLRAMVEQVSGVAARLDHHPDILVCGHARLVIESWSHTRKDVTLKDFILAYHIEHALEATASGEVPPP